VPIALSAAAYESGSLIAGGAEAMGPAENRRRNSRSRAQPVRCRRLGIVDLFDYFPENFQEYFKAASYLPLARGGDMMTRL
jgi:hypothetical protein